MGLITNNPPKNLRMSREDAAEWMDAYRICNRKGYQRFKGRHAFRIVIPPRGAKILWSTTRTDYKVEKSVAAETKSTFVRTRGSASSWNR